MAVSISFNLSEFEKLLNEAIDEIRMGARDGLQEVMEDWQEKSTNVAPLDTGELRRNIKTDITGDVGTANLTGEITTYAVSSYSEKWPNFNYAYYLHEVFPRPRFAHPTTPGTIPKFFDEVAMDNERQWKQDIEHRILQNIRKGGKGL